MKQVTGRICTYSSDEFGICSALYELGGMVVMHDASGCNSTYTTHDEPRWYDMDSMIFISAISEAEAIMGDDDKFIHDLTETAQELQPEFVALVGAPIPYMIGTDLDAIARIVQEKTGIPAFGFAANGMNDYTKGISMALKKIVQVFCEKREYEKNPECPVVNIIGATPLDFSLNRSVESMQAWITENRMQNGVCLAMGCTKEQIGSMAEADVNLVVSRGGLAAAEYMEENFGIPYVAGIPFGERFGAHLAEEVRKAAADGASRIGYPDIEADSLTEKKKYVLIGDSVFASSLAAALWMEAKMDVRVLCPLDTEEKLLKNNAVRTPEEDDILREIKDADAVIADPLYRPLTDRQKMIELPHEAFSGRIYDSVNPNLIGANLKGWIEQC